MAKIGGSSIREVFARRLCHGAGPHGWPVAVSSESQTEGSEVDTRASFFSSFSPSFYFLSLLSLLGGLALSAGDGDGGGGLGGLALSFPSLTIFCFMFCVCFLPYGVSLFYIHLKLFAICRLCCASALLFTVCCHIVSFGPIS